MAGSRAMSAREPGQVRKEAALSGHLQALRGRPTGACGLRTRPGAVLDGGCTVRFHRRPRAPGGRAPGDLTDVPVSPSASLYPPPLPRTFAYVVGQDHVV